MVWIRITFGGGGELYVYNNEGEIRQGKANLEVGSQASFSHAHTHTRAHTHSAKT